MLRVSKIAASVGGIGVILSAGTGHAQTPNTNSDDAALQEVVITAERRTENLQNTAASVTVRSGDDRSNAAVAQRRRYLGGSGAADDQQVPEPCPSRPLVV